jgi:hypothetical protein
MSTNADPTALVGNLLAQLIDGYIFGCREAAPLLASIR